jgi:hypothetical protein
LGNRQFLDPDTFFALVNVGTHILANWELGYFFNLKKKGMKDACIAYLLHLFALLLTSVFLCLLLD